LHLLDGTNIYVSLLIVFILKLLQEYWLHIADRSIVEDLFKIKRYWLPS
jgi:hypothetical protein